MAFVRACAVDDVSDGKVVPVSVDGIDVAIVRIGGEFFVIDDECSHASVPLSEGDVDASACQIECWMHGSMFDLRTGAPTNLPATAPVPTYSCRIDGDDLLVDVSTSANGV
jgi:3-phenylpropionate/trans-cinnamate dioxygenase ferredoxin subunit